MRAPRDLVFLVAIGVVDPRFIASVSWCVDSLRGPGCFDGDIVIITDDASAPRLAGVAPAARLIAADPDALWEPGHARAALQRFQITRLAAHRLIDLEPYDTFMYLDADILAIRDIRPLFENVTEFRYAREFAPMSGPAYSGTLTDAEMPDARFRRGINSGTFVVPAGDAGDVFDLWRTELELAPDQLGYDQPILNALVLRNQIRSAAMPAHAVAFPLFDNFAAHVTADTQLLHYCGGDAKFDLMEAHHRLLRDGAPPHEVIALTADDIATSPAWRPAPSGPPMVVAIDDTFDTVDSTSLVNQGLAAELAQIGHRVVSSVGADDSPDVVVHHNLKRPFMENVVEPGIPHVAIRSWDFGPFPRDWVERINSDYDQLWVHSEWILQNAIEGGVDPGRIRHVPLGVDTDVFTPIGPKYALPTEKSFCFLFVGGSVVRKGIDVLLAAYTAEFTRDDDVTLVIKDHSKNVFYGGRNSIEEIQERAADPNGPEIILIDEHLRTDELAALFRSADVGVWPYRAEGFVLPALECLACGTPTMVPRVGPTSDFSTDRTSFLLPARVVDVPFRRSLRLALGFEVDVDGIRIVETRVDELAATMRACVETPRFIRAEKGAHAVAMAHARFSRRAFGQRAEAVLAELVAGHR